MRTLVIVALAATLASACKDAAKKIDKALDKLDQGEAQAHLDSAKKALANNQDAPEDCSWIDAQTGDLASAPAAVELRQLCGLDMQLMHATRALTRAESARAEQPEAPTLTECQSDDWAQAKQRLDRDHASDARWTALQARWSKACAGS